MLKNHYIKDAGRCFQPIYVVGEIYGFYINFDQPITDPNFENFRLDLIDVNGGILQSNIGVLTRDLITSVSYNLYCEAFMFPYVETGEYYFVITDSITGERRCKSNLIKVENEEWVANTAMVHFRHNRTLFGVRYGNIPEAFYQRFRLPLNKIDFQYEVDKKQYRNASDKDLRNLYSYRDKFVKIETYYFDEPAHDAFSVLCQHSSLIIDGTRYTIKDDYQVEVNIQTKLNKGTVDAYEQEKVFDPIVPNNFVYVLAASQIELLTPNGTNLINA